MIIYRQQLCCRNNRKVNKQINEINKERRSSIWEQIGRAGSYQTPKYVTNENGGWWGEKDRGDETNNGNKTKRGDRKDHDNKTTPIAVVTMAAAAAATAIYIYPEKTLTNR